MFEQHLHQQNLADQLLELIDVPTKTHPQQRAKRRAYDLLKVFEGGMWHTRAFEDTFKDHPAFAFREGKIIHVGDGDVREDVCALLADYDSRLPKPIQPTEHRDPDDIPTMTTAQAAEYLGVSEDTIYLHATRKRTLHGELIGGKVMLFSKNELERYKPLLGHRGRPRKIPQNAK
ncbi:MAG: helix-turn-helix domain-containing protein [Anaerolineae bacterium]|nr:helix-turn-helix domain-containing protein [Anaerolineae bacterium]